MVRSSYRQFLSSISILIGFMACVLVLSACDKSHRDAVIHNNAGVEKLQVGMLKEALAEFDKAVEADPSFAPPYFYRGHIQAKMGHPTDAITSLQKSLELESNHPEAHYEIALAYLGVEKHSKAVTHFNTAIEQDPNHGKSYYQLGLIAIKARSYAKANDAFRKAITYDPSQISAFAELGQLYEHFGSNDEAIQVYREAIRLNQEDTTNRKLLANLLFNRSQEDEALELLLGAVARNPDDPELYFNLGVAYDRAWNKSKITKGADPKANEKNRSQAIHFFNVYCNRAEHAADGNTWPNLELARVMRNNILQGARVVY